MDNTQIEFQDNKPVSEMPTEKGPISKKTIIALVFLGIYALTKAYDLYESLTTEVSVESVIEETNASSNASPAIIVISIVFLVLTIASFICSIVFGAK